MGPAARVKVICTNAGKDPGEWLTDMKDTLKDNEAIHRLLNGHWNERMSESKV
jgi:hypothetical protein